jgi:sulfite exporter TauE/SafE
MKFSEEGLAHRNLYKTILYYMQGRYIMENLTLLGIIYVIVGLVFSVFIFMAMPLIIIVTLILLIFGLLLIAMGRKNTNYGYARYPMFMSCPACGRYIDYASTVCPKCEQPIAV